MPFLAACGLLLAGAPLLALVLLGSPGLPALLWDPVWQAAILRSLRLAAVATPLALALGFAEACVWNVLHRLAKPVFGTLCCLPLLLPVAMRLQAAQDWADRASAEAHETALLLAHTLPAAALAFLLISHGLGRIDRCLVASVNAFGGGPLAAWRLVAWPELGWSLLAAAAGSFAATMGLTMADTTLAAAFHPTLGAMLTVSLQTYDAQTAPAGLILLVLTATPVLVIGGLWRSIRR